jgi:aminoglycoside phosphotransferase (APT) family kinase protein
VTVPVHVDWAADAADAAHAADSAGPADYVLRMAPAPADIPVFRSYRLADQFEAMRLVGELTSVPVPAVRWLEPSGSVLGRPFFVMDAVNGEVPPDDQRRLQEASVTVLARLHEIPGAGEKFRFLLPRFAGDTPLRRHLAWVRDWYQFAADDLAPCPLAEQALDWLDANCPAGDDETVLCWGDSRIGNILYQDFSPAGVLDWEMATIGPPQLDVAWMIFSHRVFEHLAGVLEMPGMPGFLRAEDVIARYEELTGRRVGDLTWYYVYAAVQWAVVFMRTGTSQVRFKEREMPTQVEELLYHRGLLEEIAGAVGALS